MNSMNENENVPFDQMPQLHTGSFLTKEQAEQFKDTFKNLTVVVRCKDCKQGVESYNVDAMLCNKNGRYHGLDWFCADGERRNNA